MDVTTPTKSRTRLATNARAQRMQQRLSDSASGLVLVAGALLGLSGNLLHPRWDADLIKSYYQIASSNRLAVSDLVIMVALVLLIVGFRLLADQYPGGLSGHARLAAIVGGSLALGQTGIELSALGESADQFAAAHGTNQVGAFWSTAAVDQINAALFATWTVLLLGIAPILMTGALRLAGRSPWWQTALGSGGGLLCLVVGILELATGGEVPSDLAFLMGSLLVTAWFLTTGAEHLQPHGLTPEVQDAVAR